MKFIVPQNYDFQNKLFGFLDYNTAIFLIFLGIIIFAIINFFAIPLIFKISVFLIFFFPLLILGITGFYKENLIDVIFYLIKYLCSQKIYLYM